MTRAPAPARATGVLAALALAVAALAASAAAADPARPDPVGALGVSSELALTGGAPRQRAGAHAAYYLTHRHGVYLALGRATFDRAEGQVTAGVAYRAAMARPRLELVLHADAGVAWPRAPVAGAGLHAYLWPTRLPIALTSGFSAHAIVDGLDHSRVAISLALGLAVAR